MLSFDATPDERQLFLEEAEEQLQLLDQDIVLLEREGPGADLLQEIFRAAHTLKGSSAAIGHRKMSELTHAMESVLDRLRHGRAECDTDLIDALLESLDGLRLLKEEVETLQDCGFDPSRMVQRLTELVVEDPEPRSPALEPPEETVSAAGPGGEARTEEYRLSVRIAEDCPFLAARCLQVYLEASRLGRVIDCSPALDVIERQRVDRRMELVIRTVQIEELARAIESLPEVEELLVNPREIDGEPSPGDIGMEGPDREPEIPASPAGSGPGGDGKPPEWSRGSRGSGKTVRIDVERLDDLLNLVGELVIDRTRLTQLGGQLRSRYDDLCVGELNETTQHIGRIIDELQSSIMKARMLPVDGLFNRLPRVVRDLAQRSGKKVELVVEGRETELDRSVIEELHDPLVHLLRNCVDHGIEMPKRRLATGKPEIGRIRLSAQHRENRILLTVEDDGAGIDRELLKATAVRRGLLTSEAAQRLSDQEAVELIFASGFSTAAAVTDMSGRGVGMDIVKTNLEKLNGSVAVHSRWGEGTRFTLELPLTLAIVDALMVGLGDQILAIPLVSVVETLRVGRADLRWINRRQAIQLRESVLPLMGLDRALGLPPSDAERDRVFVVAVRVGEHRFGLVVDSLLGELQVVIKSLGRQVGNIPGVTGATILGDGRVALILDVPGLVKSVLEEQSRGWAA